MAEDYIAERLEAIRWELADLNDLADSHELEGLPRLIHAVAQDVYRAEQWLSAMTQPDKADGPSPTYWPGRNDREETGPIGDGTPHARMEWFWGRMEQHTALISELTGYSRYSSSYRFEAAIADAFDKLAEERGK